VCTLTGVWYVVNVSIPADAVTRRRNRRGQGQLLRAELLDVALRVLEDPEHEGRLSVRAVASEAGVAPQSVYLQFPDTSALRWAAFTRLFEVLAVDLDTATRAATDQRGALDAWAAAYVGFALANPARYQAMFGAVGEHHPGLDVDQLPGSAVFAGLRRRLLDVVGHRQRSTVTTCVWAGLHGLASLRISKPSFPWPPLESLVAQTIDAHVGPRPRRRTPSHTG
jgi:AcrR family transcriptional regulator